MVKLQFLPIHRTEKQSKNESVLLLKILGSVQCWCVLVLDKKYKQQENKNKTEREREREGHFLQSLFTTVIIIIASSSSSKPLKPMLIPPNTNLSKYLHDHSKNGTHSLDIRV